MPDHTEEAVRAESAGTGARVGGRGRRPLAQVRSDVLAASGELLLEEGFAGFTLEKVASRSGASRVTLYRHWPSRGALALDGYLAVSGEQLRYRDTGNVAIDLAQVLYGFVGLMEDPVHKRAFTQLIGAAQTDPDLAEAFDTHYFGPRRSEILQLLGRAQQRGQIRSTADLPTVVDLLWGPCYKRLLLPNLTGTLTRDFVDTLIATLWDGIRP